MDLCPCCPVGMKLIQLCCSAVFTVLLHVDHVTMSGVVRMQTRVCAPSFTALLSSHNQWPFSLRWWMREKCSVSKHVRPTLLSLCLSCSPCLSSCFLCSHPYTYWAPEGQHLILLSAYAEYVCRQNTCIDECRHTHVCFPMQSCDSSSLPLTSAWFTTTITHHSCRSSICGWC